MTPTDVEIEGCVKADSLMQLLSKIKDDEIQISINESELLIKGKRFESGILFDSDIRIPIDEVAVPKKMKKLPDNFKQSAKLACLTASSALSEPLLTCVYLNNSTVESCDNDRITICNLTSNLGFTTLILAENLLKLCDDDLIEAYADESWIYFKTADNVLLATRTYNEKYLDLHQFIPEIKEGTKIIFPDNIFEILARADIFSKDVISQEKNVQIRVQKHKMKVISRNETGWFTETIDTKCKEKFDFTINLEFLTDILKITNEISLIDNSLFFETENSIHLVQLDEDE